jgi:hypothetical protein
MWMVRSCVSFGAGVGQPQGDGKSIFSDEAFEVLRAEVAVPNARTGPGGASVEEERVVTALSDLHLMKLAAGEGFLVEEIVL